MLAKCVFYCSKSNKSNKVEEVNASKSCRLEASPDAALVCAAPRGDRVLAVRDPLALPLLCIWLSLEMTFFWIALEQTLFECFPLSGGKFVPRAGSLKGLPWQLSADQAEDQSFPHQLNLFCRPLSAVPAFESELRYAKQILTLEISDLRLFKADFLPGN